MRMGTNSLLFFCVSGLLLGSVLTAATPASAQEHYKLAVLTVSTEGNYETTLAGDLTLALQRAFAAYPIFDVMPSHEIDEGLYLGGIRQDLCRDIACAVKAGQVLEASVVVVGQVRRSGSQSLFDFVMVHTGSGKVVKSFREQLRGGATDLIAAMGEVAAGLVGKRKSVSTTRRPGSKLVASTQPVSGGYYESSSESGYAAEETPVENLFPGEGTAMVARKGGSMMKWTMIGALIATGAGAGFYFTQAAGGADAGGGTDSKPVTQLPGPPPFTGGN